MNIRKVTVILVPVALMFSLSSCDPYKGVDGGLYGQIADSYIFESYDDYLEFYDTFKDYNEQRYWVPSSESDIFEIKYRFYMCPIRVIDRNERRYDLYFRFQDMYAILVNDEVNIHLTFNSLDVVDFVNILSLETYVTAGDDTYEISIVHNNDVVIAYGTIQPAEAFGGELIFDNYSEEIIRLFNISAIDVFM